MLLVRTKFLVLNYLWSGNSKPNPDSFLKPFVEEANRLLHDGFQWSDKNGEIQTSRILELLCTADAPA